MIHNENIFVIGTQQLRQIVMQFDYWMYKDATDEDDKQWVSVRVKCSADQLSGEFTASMYMPDLIVFKDQLETLYKNLKGVARFSAIEGWMNLKVIGDGLGHMTSECQLFLGNVLTTKFEFEIEFDQTELSQLIFDIDKIIEKFTR